MKKHYCCGEIYCSTKFSKKYSRTVRTKLSHIFYTSHYSASKGTKCFMYVTSSSQEIVITIKFQAFWYTFWTKLLFKVYVKIIIWIYMRTMFDLTFLMPHVNNVKSISNDCYALNGNKKLEQTWCCKLLRNLIV